MNLPVIESPTFIERLPSSGIKVEFRPFLVKEHKLLLTMANATVPELYPLIHKIIRACVVGELDQDKLPYFDAVWLFLRIRAKSVGEIVQAKIKCSCGEYVDTEYNLDDLYLNKPEDWSPVDSIKFSDTLGVKFHYPSLKTAISLIDDPDQDVIVDCIEGIFDGADYIPTEGKSREELEAWFESLPIQYYEKIEAVFKNAPILTQNIEADCPSCKTHIKTEVTSLYNFFF